MFKKKPQATKPPGRIRPTLHDRHNASVFSYRASRSAATASDGARTTNPQPLGAAADRREQAKPGRLGRNTRLLLLGASLIAVLLNLIVGVHPRLVTVPEVGGTEHGGELFLHSQDQYTATATDILAGSVFNRTKVTINTKKVATDMREQFPELGSVRVSVPFIGEQPVIYLEPARPALLLAGGKGEVYIVDTTGKALATLTQVPSIAKRNLPTVSDESGLVIKVGESALPSTDVAFITEVVGQLKAKHISVSNLTLPRNTSELDLKVSGVPYIVKFNLHGDARAEAGTFLAVKQRLDTDKVVPGSYIDVRVETRAYYR